MSDHNTVGHFFENLTASMLSIIIALIGFWTTFVKNLVSRKDVVEMMESFAQSSPYVQDRQFIMERLSVNKENQIAFSNALQRNTEVMNELKIQIATLGKTLEALEEKIEQR